MEPELDADYIADGLVRFVYKHYIVLGRESQWAAEASECAAEQNGFWFYHNKLFANVAGENQGSFTRDKLETLAREAGLNVSTFKKCLDSGKYAAKVAQETEEARVAGYRGTPTFIIGDQVVQGLMSYTQMRQVIGAQLQKSGK